MTVITRRSCTKILLASGLQLALSNLTTADSNDNKLTLIDPLLPVADGWKHRKFVSETVYDNVTVDGIAAIRGRADNSASGLIKKLNFDPYQSPKIHWQWRVEQLQRSANIAQKDTEDFAAVIFFLFGKPGLLYRGIRSLGYVWTSDTFPAVSAVNSLRTPKQSRYLVLQSGEENVGRWISERRNLLDDYRQLYGEKPPELVSGISIFVDNDQTGEAVESLFGSLYAES